MRELRDGSAVRRWVDEGAAEPAIIQNIDLTRVKRDLAKVGFTDCALLGCQMDDALARRVVRQGAIVVPDLGALPKPLKCFPTELYSAASLYRGFEPEKEGSWKATPDYRGWAFFMDEDGVTPQRLNAVQETAARLHDTSMQRAAARFLHDHGKRVIGIMGGHSVPRSDPAYRKVVQTTQALRQHGYMIVTGGGPGLMEAANLGAFLAGKGERAIDVALKALPDVDFKSHDWLKSAAMVRATVNGSGWSAPIAGDRTSLAIPTWLYGHEPPNLFSSHIAKLFYNSLREDGLVTVAAGGLIFGRGSAGTVQEVFQDATQNYYRGKLTPTPMVFLDPASWTRACSDLDKVTVGEPTWSLLPMLWQLAAQQGFESSVFASNDAVEIVRFFLNLHATPTGAPRRAEVHLDARIEN